LEVKKVLVIGWGGNIKEEEGGSKNPAKKKTGLETTTKNKTIKAFQEVR